MGEPFAQTIKRILAAHPKKTLDAPALTPAGVMVLVYAKNSEYCVLLNKRTDRVDDHKGEISFPGGRMDPEDDSLLATALRETAEEMGIHPQDIETLGELDDMPTTSRYRISPYVGTIPYPYDFAPSEAEVAAVLEAPLRHLMDAANHRDEIRISNGNIVNSPSYAYDGHIIFGATARVLTRFLELLETALDQEEKPWTTNRHQR